LSSLAGLTTEEAVFFCSVASFSASVSGFEHDDDGF
jgi:hypothetical protein